MVNWGSGVVTLLITRFFASNFSPGFPDIITPEFGVQLHQLGIGGQRCWTEIRRQFATPRERTVSAARLQSSWLGDFHTPPKLGDWFVPFWGGGLFSGAKMLGLWGFVMVKGIAVFFFWAMVGGGLRRSLCFFWGSLGDIQPPPPNKTIRFLLISLDFCLKQVNKEGQTETLFWNRFSRGFSEIVSQEVAVVIQSCSPGRGGDSFVFL